MTDEPDSDRDPGGDTGVGLAADQPKRAHRGGCTCPGSS